MSDGKSDQSLEPKGGPAGKSEAKASATSPKADGKPAAGAPTEFEKKPKLSKQERRELQVFVSLHPDLYNLQVFISCFRAHFAIGPAHTKSAQESQRAAKAATKGGAAPAAPPATSKAAGASAAAAGAGAPPDRTSSAAGAAKSAPAGADGAAKDQRANSGESTKTEVTDPRRPPAR